MNERSNELNDERLGTVSGGRIVQSTDGVYTVLADKSGSDGQTKIYGESSSLLKAKHIAKKHFVSTDVQEYVPPPQESNYKGYWNS